MIDAPAPHPLPGLQAPGVRGPHVTQRIHGVRTSRATLGLPFTVREQPMHHPEDPAPGLPTVRPGMALGAVTGGACRTGPPLQDGVQEGFGADLMFAQHMVSVLRPQGMLATVMPHGVLFRGGDEKRIRQGFIEDDLLEAVIGLAPNLFYGTGIPACILVLRAKGAKPTERRGKVLFINADRDFRSGSTCNSPSGTS